MNVMRCRKENAEGAEGKNRNKIVNKCILLYFYKAITVKKRAVSTAHKMREEAKYVLSANCSR